MNRCISFVFALMLMCAVSAFSADYYEDVFALAQRLSQGGAEQEAVTEYKRYLFLQDYAAGTHVAESYTALARYYQQHDNAPLALTYTQRAKQVTTDAEALLALQRQEIDLLAALSLEQGGSLQAEPSFYAYLYLPAIAPAVRQYAWCAFLQHCVQTEQWDMFENHLALAQQEFPALFTPDELHSIGDGLSAYASFKPKHLKRAGWLSLVPGLGQLYAHDVKDAANAFVLNGALIALSVYSLVHLQFWDFSLLEFSPLLRFYRGNLYNAQKDAYAYNQAAIRAIQAPILSALQQAQARQ